MCVYFLVVRVVNILFFPFNYFPCEKIIYRNIYYLENLFEKSMSLVYEISLQRNGGTTVICEDDLKIQWKSSF